MALKRVVRELNFGGAVFATACRRIEERQCARIGDQATFVTVPTFCGAGHSRRAATLADPVGTAFEEILLAVVPIGKDKIIVEDERRIVKEIHDNRQIGDRDQTRRRLAAIDMLAPHIERRGKE